MSRVKNEAVLDRLRRLQEGRAERERQAVDASANSALAHGVYPPGHFSKTGTVINDCTRGVPSTSLPTSSVNGVGAADRAALLRASRTAPSDSVIGSSGMRESAVHQQQLPSTSIYRTHTQQLRTTPKRSSAPHVISGDRYEDFGDYIGSHHLGNGGCAPTPRRIGTPGVPQRRDLAARTVPKRTLLAETPSRVGATPNAIKRGMASPAATRRVVANDESPQSKPQWVGSTNARSKAMGARGGVTPPLRSSSRSPVGLNRTIVRRGAPEASPRTTSTFGRTPRKLVEGSSGPIVYTPGSRSSLMESGRDRSPGAKRRSLSPNFDGSRGNVSMANPSRISRGPQNTTSTNPTRKSSARTADYQRSSSLADYDSMGAYEYSDAVDRGTLTRPSPSVSGQLVKANTPTPRERSQVTEVARISGGLTQRQLFSELQHVVVQLSQTALGDQQRINDLTRKIKEYEALLMDQEKMIEELEELNVRLVAERHSQQSLRLANGERASAHADDGFGEPFGGVMDRGGFSNQRTIVSTMIQNIKEEKRQRLLVEEKSSKIIAEQQLAIHRLEQQLKDPQHGSHHLSSTTSLHRKQGGDSLPSRSHQGTDGVSIDIAENATSAPEQGQRGDSGSFATSSQTVDGPRKIAHTDPADGVFQHEPSVESSGDATKGKLDDVGTEARGLGDEARHAFALALVEAGVDISSPTEKSHESEANSGAGDFITREDDYSIPLSKQCTGSASSQPHIPRLSLIPRTASSAQPSYTVAPQAGRSASLSDTRSDSVASSARTHSVVAMSDIGEDASKTQSEPSPSVQRVDRENTCDLAHRSSGIGGSRDSVGVVSVSMSRSQANVNTLASGVTVLENEQNVTPFREQLQRHVRTMLLEGESSTELLRHYSSQRDANTNVNCENVGDLRESKERDNARASPDPYDYSHTVSALHTARSVNSQGSARSSFLRHTSVAGASLASASPPRGVIGQATAMDKILEDIKRRHNL